MLSNRVSRGRGTSVDFDGDGFQIGFGDWRRHVNWAGIIQHGQPSRATACRVALLVVRPQQRIDPDLKRMIRLRDPRLEVSDLVAIWLSGRSDPQKIRLAVPAQFRIYKR